MAEENLGRAVLALTTDDHGLDKGLDAAERKTEGWAGRVGGVLKGGLLAGAAVVAAAGVGLVKVLGDSANAAMDAERVTAQLNATLKATGGASGQTQASIEALSKSLSEITPIEDDVITSGASMLLTFKGIGKDVFPDATKAMLDMATAMNGGATPSAEQLKGTAIQLGKALNDPLVGMGALSKAGVTFSEAQKQQIKSLLGTSDQLEKLGKASSAAATAQRELPLAITLAEEKLQKMIASGKSSSAALEEQRAKIKEMRDELAGAPATMQAYEQAMQAANDPIKQQANLLAAQRIILGELNSEFKGSAEAAGGTFAGQLQILNNALGNVKEEIGMALLPVLTDLLKNYGPQLIAFAKDAAKWIISDLVPAIVTTVKWIISDLVPAIRTVVEWANVNLIPAIQDIARWIVNDLVPAVVLVVKWLVENLGPIIRDIARWIVTDFVPAVKAIIEWLQEKIPPAIATAVRVFGEIKQRIDDVSGAIRDAIRWVSDLIERIKNIKMPRLGGLNLGLGGMSAQGGLALAGAGMQSTNNIVINAPGGNPQQIRTAVIDGLATARARGLR